jgi:hypothetical protein
MEPVARRTYQQPYRFAAFYAEKGANLIEPSRDGWNQVDLDSRVGSATDTDVVSQRRHLPDQKDDTAVKSQICKCDSDGQAKDVDYFAVQCEVYLREAKTARRFSTSER